MKISYDPDGPPTPAERSDARRRALFWGLTSIVAGACGLLFGGASVVLAIVSGLNLGFGCAFVGTALLDPMGRKALPPGDDA